VGYTRIVGLGLCVVDHSYLVDGLERAGERTRYTQRRVSSGGMMGTALSQAARLGCPAHVLSVLGDDEYGRLVRRELRAAGVKTGRLVLSPRLETTVAVVLVDRDSGERRFVVPERRGLEARAPALDLGLIDARTLLLVDGHFPAQALRAVRRARAVGATVIADFHRSRTEVRRLLPHVDHAIVSEEYAASAGHADPREALRALAVATRGGPVLTLGRRGGLYLEGSRVRRFRAHRTRVVDSTGAGDVFHGAFAAGLFRGLEFAQALDLAARAAALGCTALGGAGRLMTPADMRGALRRATARARRGR
jgi:sugar/nucleoside kinase (ribokinase family)